MQYQSIMSAALLGLLAAVLVTSCAKPMDTTVNSRVELSVGGEIYLEMCNRVAQGEKPEDVSGRLSRASCLLGKEPSSDSSERFKTLHAHRQLVIDSLDHAILHYDTALPADLRQFLGAMLPLYDNGTVPAQTRAMSQSVRSVQESDEALAALERLGSRLGYRPMPLGLGMLRPLLAYPELPTLSADMLSLVQVGAAASQEWEQLLDALGASLERSVETLSPAQDTLAILTDLLISERPELPGTQPRYIVARDSRGLAVTKGDANLAVRAPFVDIDADGLADVDDLDRFVDASGHRLTVPTPFQIPTRRFPELALLATDQDIYGRPLSPQGDLYYEYINTSSTVLAATLQETHGLLRHQADALVDLIDPAIRLLGPHRRRTHTFSDGVSLNFEGYDVARSALLDIAYFGGMMAKEPVTYWLLRLSETLLLAREDEIAKVVEAITAVMSWADEPPYRHLALESNSELLQDLLQYFTKVARVPGLLEDLLRALQHPDSQPLTPNFATMMSYKDPVYLNPNDINGPPLVFLQTPVDRSAADSWENRSIMQRFVHLVHDTNGVRMCNKEGATLTLGPVTYPFGAPYKKCELLEVDNLAVFYIRSMIGRAQFVFKDSIVNVLSNIDYLLESTSEITGFTKTPTPQALNRLVFAPRNGFMQNLIDDPLSRDGLKIEELHPDTIFITEWNHFMDGLRPLLEAFSDAGREDLFADLMTLLHLHWSTPASNTTQRDDISAPLYAKQSGMARLEPMIARMLSATGDNIANKGTALLKATYETSVQGITGEDVVIDLLRHLFLPEWSPGLTLRGGEESVLLQDGFTPQAPLSPIWLAFEAARNTANQLALGSGAAGSVKNIMLHFAGTEALPNGTMRLENRRVHTLAQLFIEFAHGRLLAHHDAGDIGPWSERFTPRVRDALLHPVSATGLRFLEATLKHANGRKHLQNVSHYLLDELSPNDAFAASLAEATDLLQNLNNLEHIAPVLSALAPSLEPRHGLMNRSLSLLERGTAVDGKHALARLFAGLVSATQEGAGESVLEALTDVIIEVNRQHPGSGGSLSAEDYRRILAALRHFLDDDVRGLERLYALIQNR